MQVTIGLPFYNNENTLAHAIRSIFVQTFQDWELILMDDGSTDGSLHIARSVLDRRVRVVSDGLNRGLACRLNDITTMARGKYIARMDADDLMHPRRLERQAEYLDNHPEISLLGTSLFTIDSRNHPVGKRRNADNGVTYGNADPCHIPCHPSVMARAEWSRANPYDSDLRRSQDLELWYRTACQGTLRGCSLAEPLLFYREEGSVAIDKILRSQRARRAIIRHYGPRLYGRRGTWHRIIASQLKSILYIVTASIGKEMILVNRRNIPLSDEERAAAVDIIDGILAASVPGLQSDRKASISLDENKQVLCSRERSVA